MQEKYDIEVDWQGFELHPETPLGGQPLSALFSRERLAGMEARMAQFAAGFGVSGMKHSGWLPNTRKALALAEYAREHGRLDAFRHAAMDAHWRQGLNIEDDAVLGPLAERVGLAGEAALAAASHSTYLARIDATRAEAHRLGINAIPTFVFAEPGTNATGPQSTGPKSIGPKSIGPKSMGIVGCHPLETLERVAQEAGARVRKAPTPP